MKRTLITSAMLGVMALFGLSTAVEATPTIALIGDSGTLRVTFYDANNAVTGLSATTIINPYGVPPITLNTITATQYGINLPVTGGFAASATNGGGPSGMTSVMDGKLDFYITLDSASPISVSISEGGMINSTGVGTASLLGGAVVSGLNVQLVAQETKSNSFGSPTIVGTSWTNTDVVGGFSGAYLTYKISIDNTLLAEAISSANPGTATVTKNQFSIVIDTNPSGGSGTPEPASLGILALGGLALLARRRKA